MTQIILESSAIGKLNRVTHPVEVCDAAGQVIGKFVPRFDPSQYEIVGGELTAEELRQREQSMEWYSTDEVLANLKKLEQP